MNKSTRKSAKAQAELTSIASIAQGKALPPAPKVDAPKNEAPVVSKSVIPAHYRKQYKTFRADEQRTSGGNPTINNGDNVAMKLLGKTVKEVYEYVAAEMAILDPSRGVNVEYLTKRYSEKNDGMKRMNAGNILRNTLKRMAAAPKAE